MYKRTSLFLLCNFCQSKKIANFDFDQKLLSFDQNKLNIHQMIVKA